jgi:hypothetical protein
MTPQPNIEQDLRSPSSTCFQRKMSAVVIAKDDETEHDGRPTIVVQKNNRLNLTSLTRPALLFKRANTVPLELDHQTNQRPHGFHDFCRIPAQLSLEYWSDPPASAFKVSNSEWSGRFRLECMASKIMVSQITFLSCRLGEIEDLSQQPFEGSFRVICLSNARM